MKPYFETELGKLYNGDCLEVMDYLIKQGIKVDAIITDPPYGTTACKWDNVIPFNEMWIRLKKLRKEKTPIVLFGSEPFSSHLRLSNIENFKYDWIWDKCKAGNIMLGKYQPMKVHEIITIFHKHNYYPIMIKRDKIKRSKNYGTGESMGGNKEKENKIYSYTHKLPESILEISNASQLNKHHPTQKPLELIKYLIETYTKQDDLVLDFTSGSGTLAEAAEQLKRRWICIELEEKYCKVTKQRFQSGIQQTLL